MMKITSAIVLSLAMHTLLVMPIAAKNTKRLNKISFSISKIDVVAPKVNEKTVVVVSKSVHGKMTKTAIKKKINSRSAKGNPEADKYIRSVREMIIDNYTESAKAKKLKLKGEVLVKVQIQENGSFDVLFIGGTKLLLSQLAEKTFKKIKKFPAIPESAGMTELQLKIPVKYDFSK